jgi:catechol 2,3-dioxygenase-like lactoylglutathione lyase family enzyme
VTGLDRTMSALQAAGAKVLTPPRDVPGLFRIGFIEDPWGVKIELVEDPEPPGFHHIHLRVPDPEASLAWYAGAFGGERTRLKGRLDAVKYSNPDVWLLAQKGDDVAPSRGRAIDHLGWAVPDVEAKVRDLRPKAPSRPTRARSGT